MSGKHSRLVGELFLFTIYFSAYI